MSLNNVQLSPITIADLYRKSLVELTETLPQQASTGIKKEEKAVIPLQYLGKNLKNITILVHYPDQAYLPEEDLNFLTAILKACQLNMGDIAIINMAKQQTELDSLIKELGSRQLIVFGDVKQPINNNIDLFVIKDLQGITTLTAPELGTLNEDNAASKQLKGKLWLCLKQLFNI